MRQVVLIFPDNARLVDYILNEQISHVEVNSSIHSLVSLLTDQQIVTACTWYGALLERCSPLYLR